MKISNNSSPFERAYRLRTAVQWDFNKINVAARLVDSTTSQVVYFGQCNNPGVGTFLNSRKAMDDCFNAALDRLE